MFAPGRVYGGEKSMVGGSASRKVRSYGREYGRKLRGTRGEVWLYGADHGKRYAGGYA